MKAWLVAALLLVPVVQADYLMERHDAVRSGLIQQLPASYDVAMVLQLPGLAGHAQHPLIIGDDVWVMSDVRASLPLAGGNSTENRVGGLFRINTTTGDMLHVPWPVEPVQGAGSLASDGKRIFVVDGANFWTLDLDGTFLHDAVPLSNHDIGYSCSPMVYESTHDRAVVHCVPSRNDARGLRPSLVSDDAENTGTPRRLAAS